MKRFHNLAGRDRSYPNHDKMDQVIGTVCTILAIALLLDAAIRHFA